MMSCSKHVRVPRRLKKGDRVGIIAPASTVTEEKLQIAIDNLRNRGFIPVLAGNITGKCKNGLPFDSKEERAFSFNKFASDPEIKAIFCARGGYGSMHIMPDIDFAALKKNKPVLVGYSDITALQTAIFKKTGLISFHGPMPAANAGANESFDLLFDMLINPAEIYEIKNLDNSSFSGINTAEVCGKLVGGNLRILCSLMGTPYEIDTKGKILFIEEIGEKPYALHRMMWQLFLGDKLRSLRGVIIGSLVKCGAGEAKNNPSSPAPNADYVSNFSDANSPALAALLELLIPLKIPIIYNVHAGHNKNPLTLPIGAAVRIKDNRIFLTHNVVE